MSKGFKCLGSPNRTIFATFIWAMNETVKVYHELEEAI